MIYLLNLLPMLADIGQDNEYDLLVSQEVIQELVGTPAPMQPAPTPTG